MAPYFADDASIMQENKDLEKLAKNINKDLSNLSYEGAKKLCLN